MAGLGELLGSLFGGAASGQDGTHLRMWNELKPWVASLSRAATNKWLPRIAAGIECEVPVMRRAVKTGDCENLAVASCIVCRRPVCMSHSHINQDGEPICYLCVADAMNVVPPYQRQRAKAAGEESPRPRSYRRAPPPPPNDPPPPRAGGPTPLQIVEAFQTLGLKPGVSWEQVRTTHRKLSALNHPDKKRTESGKRSAEARFKEVQAAFELLKTQYPGAT